jgi:hypothetical protein
MLFMSLHSFQHVAELLIESGEPIHHQHSGEKESSEQEECVYCVLVVNATNGFYDLVPNDQQVSQAEGLNSSVLHASKPESAGFCLRAPPLVNV